MSTWFIAVRLDIAFLRCHLFFPFRLSLAKYSLHGTPPVRSRCIGKLYGKTNGVVGPIAPFKIKFKPIFRYIKNTYRMKETEKDL